MAGSTNKAVTIFNYLTEFADEWQKNATIQRCGLHAVFCDECIIIGGDLNNKSSQLLVNYAASKEQAILQADIHLQNNNQPLSEQHLNQTVISKNGSKFVILKNNDDQELTTAKAKQDVIQFLHDQPYKRIFGYFWN